MSKGRCTANARFAKLGDGRSRVENFESHNSPAEEFETPAFKRDDLAMEMYIYSERRSLE
jgi:hypothetical protein